MFGTIFLDYIHFFQAAFYFNFLGENAFCSIPFSMFSGQTVRYLPWVPEAFHAWFPVSVKS